MPRNWVPLAHDWRFIRADVPAAREASFDDAHWSEVSVPHTFNAADTCVAQRFYYRGPAWYRRTLPEAPRGARVELVALGAFAVANVWVNGVDAGEYMGGFTGFCIDITPHLRPGAPNVLAIRVTNEHDPEVLPGKDIPDYNLYGGIYREIGLRVTDPLRIADRGIVVDTPRVEVSSGEVALTVNAHSDRAASADVVVRATLTAPDGSCASTGEARATVVPGATAAIPVPLPAVPNPCLWSTDAPNLYRLSVTLSDASGEIDADALDIGFRWFAFDPDIGFHLNGKPLKLRGMNRHQDMPGIGSAIPASFQDYDVRVLRDLGCNFVRCSHYPMHPAFLDACDRLGVLVYEEIASWQHIGGERFARNAVAMMQEMIARDRHHPSIILWGLLNEGRDPGLFRQLDDAAHACDPYRQTTYAENHPEKAIELETHTIPDVLGINYRTEDLDMLRDLLPGIPLFCSEHTNADIGRRGALDRETLALFRILHDIDEFERRDWLAGSTLWCMHDYGTALDVTWPVHFSGCVDGWRQDKLAAIGIRARWNPAPLVHIVGHWNHSPLPSGDPHFDGQLAWAMKEIRRAGPQIPEAEAVFACASAPAGEVPVVVISNMDRVELTLNGRSLGTRDRADGLVWSVPYEPGILRATGSTGATTVSHEVRTAASPEGRGSIRLEALHNALPANGADITLITATVLDADGIPALWSSRAISFRVTLDGEEGGAEVLGLGGFPGLVTQSGTGRIVLRAGRRPGRLRIVADGVALRESEISMELTPSE